MPAALSEIILRLLEKEPDRRYQSATGLEHDLRSRPRRLVSRHDPVAGPWRARFSPTSGGPSRLVADKSNSRPWPPPFRPRSVSRHVACSSAAFPVSARRACSITSAHGHRRLVLYGQVRPVPPRRRRRRRPDRPSADLADSCRLSPRESIIELRARLLEHLDANASLIAGVIPEFGSLLGIPPELPSGDLLSMAPRLNQAGLDLLRAIALPQPPRHPGYRDDLQWATSTPIGFIDTILTDEDLRGVLIVGAYAITEVDAAHPMTAMLDRCSVSASPPLDFTWPTCQQPALSNPAWRDAQDRSGRGHPPR